MARISTHPISSIIETAERWKRDVENPRGGIRHLISGKGFYEDKK